MRKIISYVATLILLIGMMGFVLNILMSMDICSYVGELPIVRVQGVVEQEDKLYIGLAEYNRIQVYDLNGHYQTYFKVENYGKDFDFTIDRYGIPSIIVVYARKKTPSFFMQNNGNQYSIKSQFPLIVERTDPFTVKQKVIEQPWYWSLWAGSIHSWFMGLCGIIVLVIVNIQIIFELGGDNCSKEEKIKLFLKKVFIK